MKTQQFTFVLAELPENKLESLHNSARKALIVPLQLFNCKHDVKTEQIGLFSNFHEWRSHEWILEKVRSVTEYN